MKKLTKTILSLSALANETRLHAFRILVAQGSGGMAAGALSDRLGIPHNTLSFHLSHLSDAGLVTARKQGRSIIYSANLSAMQKLVYFLSDNCGADNAALSPSPR